MARTKKGLTKRILIGMIFGVAVGVAFNLLNFQGSLHEFFIEGVFQVGGKIFIASLKLLVVPVVFISLVTGTASLGGDLKEFGKIGGKTIGLYLMTTAIAVTIALLVAIGVRPGLGLGLLSSVPFEGKEAPTIMDTIVGIFPTNPIQAMAEGNMLQIIVFAILFGFGISAVGKTGERVFQLFQDLNEIVLKLILMLMEIAPYGVFFLLAKVFATQGFSAILPLAKYFFCVLFVLFLHVGLTYPIMLKTLSGLNPFTFFKKFKEVMVFAFSTASSNATIPITLETVEKRLGVKNSVASFTIPLGATVNMDGTAIMQGVATVFVAQAYGIQIGLHGYLMVIFTATLASIGTAGVPGAGLIMLAMVFKQVGLPVEGIGLIIGVDRLLDMVRTAVNVTGDAAVTCIVAKSEKLLSTHVFNAKNSETL